jgi:hypothetical protein
VSARTRRRRPPLTARPFAAALAGLTTRPSHADPRIAAFANHIAGRACGRSGCSHWRCKTT